MTPRFAIFKRYTTSAANDPDQTGPEYEGRLLAITWLGWTFEIALTRKGRA